MNFATPLGEQGAAQSSKTVKDKDGNDQLAMGGESLQGSMAVGMSSISESASSVTKSGINTKNIEIRNAAAQQQLTGKSVEEMKAELNTDITTDTVEARSGKLENRFDKDKMQKELDYQVKVTQEFQTITLPVIDKQMNKQAEEARKAAKDAAQKGDNQTANKLNEEATKWETGGTYRQAIDAVSRAVGLALGGTPTEGVVAAAASPYINEQIKHATKDNPTANAIAHAVWGAVESKFQGGRAEAGAIAATAGELGAAYIAEELYGTNDPNKLTEAQKQTVTELSKTAAGLASGLTVATSGGNSLETAKAAQTGQGIAESAVENNLLLTDYSNLKGLAKTETERDKRINEKLRQAGIENMDDYAKQYKACNTEQSCQQQVLQSEMQAIEHSYQIIEEMARKGELTLRDIDYISSTVVPRLRSAYDSKVKDPATQAVYREGDLRTFAKSEQHLMAARFNAQLKHWVELGLTDQQILKKIDDDPLSTALSTVGPNIGGRQPSGSGRAIPNTGHILNSLASIRKGNTSSNNQGNVSNKPAGEVNSDLNIGKNRVGFNPSLNKDISSNGKDILLHEGYYYSGAMKISSEYYNKLWRNGRPAPFVQAREIMTSKPKITHDPRGREGFYRYEANELEMIYNPQTKEIWHIQPIPNRR